MKFIVFQEIILENKWLEPKNGALGRWCSNSNLGDFAVQPLPFIFSRNHVSEIEKSEETRGPDPGIFQELGM